MESDLFFPVTIRVPFFGRAAQTDTYQATKGGERAFKQKEKVGAVSVGLLAFSLQSMGC